ncbi:MAG TPA: DUF6338 family protein [Caulobacteraceae bacterium]|jgi:hypothetical protein
MLSIDTIAEAKSFIALLAPGMIILWVRARFLGHSTSTALSERILAYLAISAAYFGVVSPIIGYAGTALPITRWALNALEYGLVPVTIGLMLAVANQWELGRRLANRIGLNPIHGIPTAWDWSFHQASSGAWLLITLKDGSEVAGLYGEQSFASTSPAERDIYLERVYARVDGGAWEPLPEDRGILLRGEEIRFVEFFGEQSDE